MPYQYLLILCTERACVIKCDELKIEAQNALDAAKIKKSGFCFHNDVGLGGGEHKKQLSIFAESVHNKWRPQSELTSCRWCSQKQRLPTLKIFIDMTQMLQFLSMPKSWTGIQPYSNDDDIAQFLSYLRANFHILTQINMIKISHL